MPGQPGESLLIEKVAEGEMPPNGPLSKDQVAVVRAWIESGAAYPSETLAPRRAGADWWSLRPIRRIAAPEFKGPDAAWVRTPIDRSFSRISGSPGLLLHPRPIAPR